MPWIPKENSILNLETALVPVTNATKPPEDEVHFNLAEIMKEI